MGTRKGRTIRVAPSLFTVARGGREDSAPRSHAVFAGCGTTLSTTSHGIGPRVRLDLALDDLPHQQPQQPTPRGAATSPEQGAHPQASDPLPQR